MLSWKSLWSTVLTVALSPELAFWKPATSAANAFFGTGSE